MPRSLALETNVSEVAKSKPLLIDESDATLAAFPAARSLGYSGVSSKSCKGLYKSLLNAARCNLWNSSGADGHFLSGEDLTMQAGLAVQQDLALACDARTLPRRAQRPSLRRWVRRPRRGWRRATALSFRAPGPLRSEPRLGAHWQSTVDGSICARSGVLASRPARIRIGLRSTPCLFRRPPGEKECCNDAPAVVQLSRALLIASTTLPLQDSVVMVTERLGIIMNGVTGRMGTNQHLIRSICAIRNEGGVRLSDGRRVMPDPILVGRNADKLSQLAAANGVTRWTTDLDAALANKDDALYFDSASTGLRPQAHPQGHRRGQAHLHRKAGRADRAAKRSISIGRRRPPASSTAWCRTSSGCRACSR